MDIAPDCTILPTVRPPKKPTSCPPKEPVAAPAGMWFEHRPGRPLPYLARWRATDGKKMAQAFADEKARGAFAADWQRQREKFGTAARMVDAKTIAALEEFRAIVGDVPMVTVAREWRDWRGTVNGLTIESAWQSFNDDQEKRKLAGDTHSHRRLHGKRLCARFAGKLVASIHSDDLDRWIAQLADPDTSELMSSKSRAHHLKTARHFFGWLHDRRKIPHNPALAVTTPDATKINSATGEPIHRDVNILTVEQARELFRANRDALCVGRLALEAFGGLRYTSAARLRREDIVWDECGIVMPGHQHKSTNRHWVDGWQPNMWEWMKHAPDACWDLPKRQYADLKREAFERAGLKPEEPDDGRDWTPEEAAKLDAMHNVLRHSFATYHLAAFKDARLTAHLLTKTSIQSLNNDYRGRASESAGRAYLTIVP